MVLNRSVFFFVLKQKQSAEIHVYFDKFGWIMSLHLEWEQVISNFWASLYKKLSFSDWVQLFQV